MQWHRLWRLASGAGLALFSTITWSHPTDTDSAESAAQAGARVAVDPETKKLRPVEHDEYTSASRAAASRSPVHNQGAPRVIYSRSGARGMTLDESFMSFTVVRLNADGNLESACTEGEAAALKLLQDKPTFRKVTSGGRYETE